MVEAIERVIVRASQIGRFDQGFVAWAAPYPCFVDTIVYDVRSLPRDDEKLEFQLLVNTNSLLALATLHWRYGAQLDWTHVPDEIELSVRAWMLPGHGVTLLWRPR